jgi:Leucine-rich repeat (LRR) protein
MKMRYKSVTMWMLLAVLLLESVVNGHKLAAERTESDPECKSVTDELGIVIILNCSWQALISVPVVSRGQLVHTLDLSHNSLHKLHNGSFHPYPNLAQLILSSDNITRIEVETFSSLKALRKIDLSYNNLTFIHPNIFLENTKLQILSLQGNPLHTLHTPFLISMSLQSLDLSHCHLSHFSTDSLSSLPELENLNLSHNSLQQLLMTNVSALSSLQLAGNPWQCDCHFHALLMWISANQMVDSDIKTENTVQCWQGDRLKNLINKQDQDNICIGEVTDLPIRQKITPELADTGSEKDNKLVKNNYLLPSSINEDDEWMYVDDNGEIVNTYVDDDYPEEMDENSYFLYEGEVPGLSNQNYIGLSLNVTTKLGDETSRNHKVSDSTILSPKVHDFILEDTDVSFDGEFGGDYRDSEELDNDSISLLSVEAPVLDDKHDVDLNFTVNVNVGDTSNNNVGNRTDETRDTVKCSGMNNDFIHEETEASIYEYDLYDAYQDYEELDKDIDPPSSSENPGLKQKDENIIANVHHSMGSSDLQDPNITNKTRLSTTDIKGQNNDVSMDANSAYNNSQLTINSTSADDNKDDTFNNSHSYDYEHIFYDDHAGPAAEISSLKHDDYESSDTFVIFGNVNSEETGGKDEAADSAIQFINVHNDLSSEDIANQFVFNFDDTDSQEVTNKEILSADNFQDLYDRNDFFIYKLIETDAQEHKTLMNQIKGKLQNETNLRNLFIRLMMVAGVVTIFVFALVMLFYCIISLYAAPSVPKKVPVCKKMEKGESKERLLQNV